MRNGGDDCCGGFLGSSRRICRDLYGFIGIYRDFLGIYRDFLGFLEI